MVEFAECGAYQGYRTLPVNSRRSPRGGPKSSMGSRPGTSYYCIKYAYEWGPKPGSHLRQVRTRSQGGGQFSKEPERGLRLGPRSPQAAGVLLQARGPQRDKHCSRPRRGEGLGPQDPRTVGALLQARRPQGGKHYSSRPRRGECLEPQNPSAVGALLQARGQQGGKHYSSRPRRGEWLELQNPSAVGALLQTQRPQGGDLGSRSHVARRVQTAGIDRSEQGRDQLQLLSQR